MRVRCLRLGNGGGVGACATAVSGVMQASASILTMSGFIGDPCAFITPPCVPRAS